MSFADAVRSCLSDYATFSGRASRSEYWWFAAFVVLGAVVAGVADAALFGTGTIDADGLAGGLAEDVAGTGWITTESGPVATVFSLAVLVPSFAVGWRRMHDSGRSGLHLLYPLLVMAGILAFVAIMGGFTALTSGGLSDPVMGVFALILGGAVLVFMISPLLVLWWLTRPSEPEANAHGPPPCHNRGTT